MAKLELRNVTKKYGSFTALDNINVDIAHREFVVIVGPSGCGKSTLLRSIAGLEQISAGEIVVGEQAVHRVPASKRGLAMVFQNYALYPHKTVAQNMGFALKIAGVPKAEIDQRVNEAARILQIEPLLDRKPKALSGGQRQRVAMGRAIVREPKVFLFDEPLSNLDAALRVDMRVELAKLHNTLDATMIYVTHDQTEAMTMADKIVVLRAGRIEQVGAPMELYHYPASAFVAGFIGSPRMNIVPATVEAVSDSAVTVKLRDGTMIDVPVEAGQTRKGDGVSFGVRPEHLALDTTGTSSAFEITVQVVEPLGGETILFGNTSTGETIVVKTPGEVAVTIGDKVKVAPSQPMCHIFDSDENALKQRARGLNGRKVQ
ncbi:ABC transporter ATP-binding protein [Oceaniglobus trochenteri]|uniref:ABC transporter ATP-binding protein n=1 Tax=Oceaniglobus trochenteri TaxID=2763260 RepID=UPI001CFF746B|nr:sn-glycerol-3-phosphate ABC transporter ATP-binding protein UgpC [Oceaniglobus trochenteri]